METILVVEDEHSNLSAFCTALEYHGYHALAASDSQSALKLCQDHAPIHLLLTDIRLASENGAALAERIIREYCPMPVIFMSGSSCRELEREHLLQLVNFPSDQVVFLEKPFAPRDLIAAVRQLLSRTMPAANPCEHVRFPCSSSKPHSVESHRAASGDERVR
jgi:CheY-like chemotaxis protein